MSREPPVDNRRKPVSHEYEQQMELAREIIGETWVVSRALALADQYPDADADTLLKMAQEQAAMRPAP